MALSAVYTVCLMYSLLWETQMVHTKLEIILRNFLYYFNNCLMNQLDMYTKYTNDCVIDLLLLSAT